MVAGEKVRLHNACVVKDQTMEKNRDSNIVIIQNQFGQQQNVIALQSSISRQFQLASHSIPKTLATESLEW